ncbi:hypothetical protein PR202_ga17570 [Eleusine coracana subsp. coracana]|uniref:Uncharacterized protein n=1 Tax=Eleusine coracana subsp. coracana TaxID=191504 RepID=A0AAV5CQL8_ELECO|nr:hypothetical protein PR202_ga17323 [Eleusine coracana subsp. coracana]GJN00391.1 hypothetical protein PR202_ga17570 [Eleusine coracana subsp. coracana]
MELLQRPNGSRLKRKLADDCLTKHSKSHHVEVQNISSKVKSGSLSDPHARRCCIQPNLADDCVNYLRSTVPSRVVFYKGDSWCNFPEQVLPSLVDAFKDEKSSVVIVMEDQPLLVDFLSMTLVNLRTKKQRSVAWLDGAGKWFVPSAFFDEEADETTKLDMNAVEGSGRRITGDKVVMPTSETLKQVVLENIPPVPQNSCTADILRNILVSVERGSESFMFAQNLFLSGMGSFATPNSIVRIHRYSPKHVTAKCRLETFERQMKLTSERSGGANTRYGWLGSRKKDIIKILIDGFVSTEKTTENAGMDPGIYLSPENRAFASFRLAPNIQEYLAQKALWFHPPPKEGLVDLSTLQPENKITREEMVKKMILIIGEKLLVDSLTKVDKCSPSQWYKPPAKVATDTTITKVNSICADTGRIAPPATSDHDYPALSVVPVKCEPIDSHCGGSPLLSVAPKGQEFPSLRMSAQSSSPHCPESEPSVPITVHTVRASVTTGVPENISFVRTDNCDSVEPRLRSNGHAPLTQNSATVRCSSLISRSTLGNSESLGMKGRHTVAPVITSEVPESLATGLPTGSSLTTSAAGSDAATASILPQFQPPSILRRSHVRSMAPHLRVPRQTSHVHTQGVMLQSFKKSVMLQAQYSGAITMIPVSSTPPAPSGAPKRYATATPSEPMLQTPVFGPTAKGIDCAAPSVAQKSTDRTTNLTAEGRRDSTLKNTVSSNEAFQCGASNSISIAADVLTGTYGRYEKGM